MKCLSKVKGKQCSVSVGGIVFQWTKSEPKLNLGDIMWPEEFSELAKIKLKFTLKGQHG